MKHGSLFAGIGGFDLGFERAGIETIWQVEIDEYCRKVLARHFPHAQRFSDIRECGAHNLLPVDVLSGGFPCQDISNAGKRAGIDGERSGLWSEYARIIRELRPRYVIVENVAALLGRGMERVLGDLAACGYDAEWQSIRASDVGAPHRRERIWIVAYSQRSRWRQSTGDFNAIQESLCATERGEGPFIFRPSGEALADADSGRCEQRDSTERSISEFNATSSDVSDAFSDRSTQWMAGQGRRNQGNARILVHDSNAGAWPENIGAVDWWAVEPDVGRVAHGVPARVDRLRGLGNAIVPQIAEWIGKRLMAQGQPEIPPQYIQNETSRRASRVDGVASPGLMNTEWCDDCRKYHSGECE